MSEWQETTLGKVAFFQRGHDLPKTKMVDGKIPVAGSNGIIGYHNESTTKAPCLTIGRSGNIGTPQFYKCDFWAHNTVLYVKDFFGNDEKFVFYFLQTHDLSGFNSGSAVPTLNRNHIHGLSVTIPQIQEQKAIAAVLSCLDDKIDLLHRQNKTLEAMAETLFRQWFIEEAQEDWEEAALGELVKVIDNRGKTPLYQDIPTPYPIIEVNALAGDDRLVNYSAIRKYVTEETHNSWFRGHPKKYDTLLSTVGSIGEISMFLIEKGCIAQNVIALQAVNISSIYLYEFLKSIKDEIKELDIGSVQPSIKVPHLLSMTIIVPPIKKVDLFDEQVKNYLDKLLFNSKQIRNLEKLRDTLLPKLMSGEVRVVV
jgi:type I restriction enzyme, S subunit